MPIRRKHQGAEPRRGIILLVVLALLTLFAIAGLTFVLYADQEATTARIAADAETNVLPDMEPELAFSYALGQLLYGAPDDTVPGDFGVYSSLRGQDLSTNLYGWLYDPKNPTANAPNDKPFSGTGRLHYPSALGQDDYNLINYNYYSADGFIRFPGRLFDPNNPLTIKGPYAGGLNPSYTYPDLNNFYLGAMQSSDGKVLVPSFHRDYLFGSPAGYPGNPSGAAVNPNWINRVGKYLTLRPRPVDQLQQADVVGAGLPWPLPLDTLTAAQQTTLQTLVAQLQSQGKLLSYPEPDGFDVKNLDWAPGGNDSLWMDIGAPVMVAADGRKFKMLVAPLILDLDNRINLNVAGNVLGQNNSSSSLQAFGPWEQNVSFVLSATSNGNPTPTEWQNLLLGSPTTGTPHVVGRLGTTRRPIPVASKARCSKPPPRCSRSCRAPRPRRRRTPWRRPSCPGTTTPRRSRRRTPTGIGSIRRRSTRCDRRRASTCSRSPPPPRCCAPAGPIPSR
jgi:hypothetical protein